jgi:hypothetical protein
MDRDRPACGEGRERSDDDTRSSAACSGVHQSPPSP